MTYRKIGTFRPGSPQWHAARAKGIGGSEISAILGLNPWESYFSLWHRKKGNVPPTRENEAMKMGSLFEPVIYQDWVVNRLPASLRSTTGDTYQSIEHPFMVANPDGLMWDKKTGELVSGLEIKCAGRDDKWGSAYSDQELDTILQLTDAEVCDEIPIYYRCQVAWYCAVMGLKRMYVRAVFGVGDWRTYVLEPLQSDIDYLISEGEKFMHALANDTQPDIDKHTQTYVALKAIHPGIDRTEVVDIGSDLAGQWWQTKAALEVAEENHQGVKNRLADVMGEAWKAVDGDEAVAYRQIHGISREPFIKSAKKPIFYDTIKEAVDAA